MATIIDKDSLSMYDVKEYKYQELNDDSIKKESTKEMKDQYKELLKELRDSIKTVEQSVESCNKVLDEMQNQLIEISLGIAQNVIQKELSQNSSDVAVNLSAKVVEKLKDMPKIKLKVNPKDYIGILEYFKDMEHVKVVEDSDIDIGGVVAVSNTKKIDAQISKRFKKAKKVMDCENRWI